MRPTFDGETPETWLNGLNSMRDHNIKHLLTTFAYFGIPESFLDVGCGDGITVEIARKLHVRAYGVDQLVQEDWPDYFFYQNLVDAFRLQEPVDLVYCLEVAEHIHETAHSTLIDTICENMKADSHAMLVFSAAGPGQDGTGHVACIAEGTEINASGTRFMTRRFYDGEAVTIVTANGNNLTVTPNHPILTKGGWIHAGFLYEGCDVICCGLGQREPVNVVPNYNERPTKVEEVFRSFSEVHHSIPLRVPLSSEDFHGDGIPDSEVDIVYSNSFRHNNVHNPSFSEPFFHLSIEDGDPIPSPLCSSGLFFLDRDANFHSNPTSMRFFHYLTSFFRSHSRHAKSHLLRSSPNFNAVPFQDPNYMTVGGSIASCDNRGRFTSKVGTDDIVGVKVNTQRFSPASNMDPTIFKNFLCSSEVNMSPSGKFSQGLPGVVFSDKVIKIKRSNFNGHVYNLHTKDEYYLANGIITHNCRPAFYWRTEFTARGLTYNRMDTLNLALLWSHIQSPLGHLSSNLQVFEK